MLLQSSSSRSLPTKSRPNRGIRPRCNLGSNNDHGIAADHFSNPALRPTAYERLRVTASCTCDLGRVTEESGETLKHDIGVQNGPLDDHVVLIASKQVVFRFDYFEECSEIKMGWCRTGDLGFAEAPQIFSNWSCPVQSPSKEERLILHPACDLPAMCLFGCSTSTPWKTNMDPENHWLVEEKQSSRGALSGSM